MDITSNEHHSENKPDTAIEAARQERHHDDGDGAATCQQDAGSRLSRQLAEDTRGILASNRDISEGEISPIAFREAFLQAAKRVGAIQDFPHLEKRPEDAGQEHDIWFDRAGRMVWKATHANKFGVLAGRLGVATPIDYLIRIELCNEVFGFPWHFKGVWVDPFGRLRLVTTQPDIMGRPATPEEIASFFQERGFDRAPMDLRDVWINKEIGVVAEDAHGDNFVVSESGALLPIDVPIAPLVE